MTDSLTAHPLADLVPMMAPDEYAAFKADVAANGQRDAIVIHDGKILDGRHRHRACRELGIEPRTVEYMDGSPIAFVLSANLHRRHLSAGQKAILAADALPHFEAEAKDRMAAGGGDRKSGRERVPDPVPDPGKATEHAARAFGVNPRYVQDAKTIASADPDLANEVRAGKVTINRAIGRVKRDRNVAEARARATDLTGTGVDVYHADFRTHMVSMPEASVSAGGCRPAFSVRNGLRWSVTRPLSRVWVRKGDGVCDVFCPGSFQGIVGRRPPGCRQKNVGQLV